MFSSRRQNFLFANSAKTILFTICLAIGLRMLVISSYVVQTNAMSPTVDRGEFLLAWKAFAPKRGDANRLCFLPAPKAKAESASSASWACPETVLKLRRTG